MDFEFRIPYKLLKLSITMEFFNTFALSKQLQFVI